MIMNKNIEFIKKRLEMMYEGLLKSTPYKNIDDNYAYICSYLQPFLGLAWNLINDYNIMFMGKDINDETNNNPKIKIKIWDKSDEKFEIILS